MTEKISNQDITVVVQGPVQVYKDRPQDEGITCRCLGSIRDFLPGARIILSTWPDQNLDGFDYDELVINDDPGPNIVHYYRNGKPNYQNYNRQIVSTINGLKRVETRYAMKLRSDNFLTGDEFKWLPAKFPQRVDDYKLFEQRVVMVNTFGRNYSKGLKVAFHPSDFFYFGLTRDLVDIWDIPLFQDVEFDPAKLGVVQHPCSPLYIPDATQELWLKSINKHLERKVVLRHTHDIADGKLEMSDRILANNTIIASPAEIGVSMPMKFAHLTGTDKWSFRYSFISFKEWQALYRRWCDRGYPDPMTLADAATLWMMRLIFVRSRGPETLLRQYRNVLGYWIRIKLNGLRSQSRS